MAGVKVEVELWLADARRPATRERAAEIPLGDRQAMEALRLSERERRRVQLAMRRSVLSVRTGTAPEDLPLQEGPSRGIACLGSGLQLSATHHDDHTVLAVAEGSVAVGVDIEPRFEADWEEALEAVLAPPEQTALAALPPGERPAAYFACWTRKEAVMKALGEGLSDRDPRSIVVSIEPETPTLRSIDNEKPTEGWAMWTGTMDELVCSLAVRGVEVVRPRLRSWPLDID